MLDPELFFRGAPDDPRLGSVARAGTVDEAAAAKPAVAIVGLPDDRGIVAGGGRAGAAQGPREIRRWLYRLTTGDRDELGCLALFDAGDVEPAATVEETHARAEAAVGALLDAGARV